MERNQLLESLSADTLTEIQSQLSQRDVQLSFTPEPTVNIAGRTMLVELFVDDVTTTPKVQPMLLADEISSKQSKKLHQHGIWFADARGNMFLSGTGFLINIEGRRGNYQTHPNKPSSISLFTGRRSQVIALLLSYDELLNQSRRTIATAAGTSVGTVQQTLELLEATHYLHPGASAVYFPDKQQLLSAWARSYAAGLGHQTKLLTAEGEVPEIDEEFLLSGEAAVADLLINPQTADLYVADRTTAALTMAKHKWRQSQDGNLIFRRQFWHTPKREVPPAIVYADLISHDSPRLTEVAREYAIGRLGV
ncbi:type IV toxin-antitoxin system AbiEi family antitoxin [Corynebacterium epidermidicanis]|uniref:Uncharacterized protein n=1 Tax=Corynebacterium epidermidicanis TaxID=1050174 RepID=A0A0G3GUT0_9CORY|nr:type IV toxin-antitoxin system AbiEi family antitoxin [Corynebacterium epidermidicanis]AKK04270.1 hypothetical protein CEPID_12235 [Corynebacterium epidermidicanis]